MCIVRLLAHLTAFVPP
jgi:hypothetical protein